MIIFPLKEIAELVSIILTSQKKQQQSIIQVYTAKLCTCKTFDHQIDFYIEPDKA